LGRKLRGLQRWWRRGGGRASSSKRVGEKPAQKNLRSEGFRVPRKFVVFVVLVLLLVFFVRGFYRFDRQILPLVLEAEELRLQTEINNVINAVVHEIIVENRITANDFIMPGQITADAKPVLSINTVLVNEICNAVAQAISERLNNMEPEIISVPIGMALGLDTLAQAGPRFTFTMAPIGNALVNYDTSFTAVGINQTHFSVWLTVEAVVRIINPVQPLEILVTRYVSLVDTIISGIVPGTYLNMDAPNVTLN